MPDHLLIVVGAGSVGKRHLRNFAALGCRLSAVDPQADRLAEAAAAVPLAWSSDRFVAADARARGATGVVICSPPHVHVEAAIASLEAGLPVFLEKPVSPTLREAAALTDVVRRASAPLLLGYTYRWWPALRALRERIRRGDVGPMRHVRCVMSAHLADWHPWERYQDFFMASLELGGGALLDESHLLDLMLWFFGAPDDVTARVEHLSGLEIETDDNVDVLLGYRNGLRVYVHLDLFGRPHEKFITAIGEDGTLQWSFEPSLIRESRTARQEWTHLEFPGERNDMFVAAAREFLQVIDGATPSCTAEDGLRVLELIEAIRTSSAERRTVRFGSPAAQCTGAPA